MGPSVPALILGLLQLVAVALVPVAMFWVLMHLDQLGDWIVAALRWCRLLPRGARQLPVPPVERIAADLRRLSAAAREVPRGTSHARRKGLLLAYDDALATACRALDVPHSLHALPVGLDRELERLRVEAALESAGLRFRPGVPRRHQDTP